MTAPWQSWPLAIALVPAASAVLAAVDPRLRHWFLIPVTVCGVLIGVDAFDWLLRRRDVFDPQAVLGLFGLHFFYLAPILHVTLDYWPVLLYPTTAQWRSALGMMALLNVAGLIVYRVIVSLADRRPVAVPSLRFRQASYQRIGAAAAAVGILAFLAVLSLLGGPDGFLRASVEEREALAGLGWLVLIGESFPLVLFSLIAVRWRDRLRRRRGLVVVLLLGLVTLQFLVGGLRGSRSTVLWSLVLGLLLIHVLVFRISRKAFLVSAAVVVAFGYGYGLYKGAGLEVLDIAKGTRSVEEVASDTGRDVPTVLLGDLARADMQALVLDRELAGGSDWAYGSTYLAAPLSLVPGSPESGVLRDKSAVGTEVLYGTGAYEAGARSERVFGLAGEAMLNFGPIGGLLSFVVLGLFLRFARRCYRRAMRGSELAPKLICPVLSAITVILLTADLDNILAFFVGKAFPLVLIVWCAMARPALVRPDPWTGSGIYPKPRDNLENGPKGALAGECSSWTTCTS